MFENISIIIDKLVLDKIPSLYAKCILINGIFVKPDTYPLLENRKKEIIEQWSGKTEDDLDTDPYITAYRALHSGINPEGARMLPAVEAMLKRGIMKKKFPRINSIVDTANITSLENMIPVGVFDYDRTEGELKLSLSGKGDAFIPIGSDKQIKLPEYTPVLMDRKGIFSAVGHRDSVRTMISSASRNVIAFSWGTDKIESGNVEKTLLEFHNRITAGYNI